MSYMVKIVKRGWGVLGRALRAERQSWLRGSEMTWLKGVKHARFFAALSMTLSGCHAERSEESRPTDKEAELFSGAIIF